ncbi:hypothetical protein L2E82_35934 [Cichorium intybus]|uniref:Uncharacterized protein n=1 Tax=Cichorium intybus TaxID=13427 RepID=A0ACB9BQ70_CICIN|nr:hypothetical protein L2E82_35934 [Cichorium intybus]
MALHPPVMVSLLPPALPPPVVLLHCTFPHTHHTYGATVHLFRKTQELHRVSMLPSLPSLSRLPSRRTPSSLAVQSFSLPHGNPPKKWEPHQLLSIRCHHCCPMIEAHQHRTPATAPSSTSLPATPSS